MTDDERQGLYVWAKLKPAFQIVLVFNIVCTLCCTAELALAEPHRVLPLFVLLLILGASTFGSVRCVQWSAEAEDDIESIDRSQE